MIKAFQLILVPFRTWEKISQSQRTLVWILCLYILPFLFAGLVLEAYSLMRFGERRGEVGYLVKVNQSMAIRYAATQAVLVLASIFLGAQCLYRIARSFQVRTAFQQCFTLMAYGFSPIILARYIDAVPGMNTWVAWVLGAFLSTSVLYHGVGLVLRPEQTKGFGLYLVSMIITILSSGLAHFIAIAVLHGKLARTAI